MHMRRCAAILQNGTRKALPAGLYQGHFGLSHTDYDRSSFRMNESEQYYELLELHPAAARNMASNREYSDLQVVPAQYSTLEHHRKNNFSSTAPEPVFEPYDEQQYNNSQPVPPKPSRRKTICGLAARTFWIIAVIVIIIVIAAAVGGGVGGSLSSSKSTTGAAVDSSHKSTAAASTTQKTPSTGPITASPTSTPAITTTQVVGSSTTLLRDCPSSNNTLYTINLGQSMSWRKICGLNYLGSPREDWVNEVTTSLDDCINLCAAYNIQNKTEILAGQSNICNAVCWRNGFEGDDYPGNCFGFTTQNSSNAFVVSTQNICDSAAWIDQTFG